jgi:flavin-dependent dehydrogenase
LKVAIFEREVFPRDHVGESQLPIIGPILNELGVWEKVEAANFPIKVGATYRWGSSNDLWDFHFVPDGDFSGHSRPDNFEGQRPRTAFQVDRAIYDQILLDHARELGCEVFEETGVRQLQRDGDKVTGLVLDDGTEVHARTYIDASGGVGFLRRAMGVGIEEPGKLRNVAIWDYWQNAEWAVNIGVGGTRVQVMSVGYGWLWFIPLGPERTSIGLVCPADYYKDSKLKPEELYLKAIADEPRISELVRNGKREHKLATTRDWSFVAERMTGENWMLIGESSGFADPILAAGLSLAHASAREAAYTILEMDRGKGKKWLREQYELRNRRRILQHIRFADFWYSSNSHFTDLVKYTSEIAHDAGLDMTPEQAWLWLGTGGFVEEDMNAGGVGTVSFVALHQIIQRFTDEKTESALDGFNGFVLDLNHAEKIKIARYVNGEVHADEAYKRGTKVLPIRGTFGGLVQALQLSPRIEDIVGLMAGAHQRSGVPFDDAARAQVFESLEAMIRDGWVVPKRYGSAPTMTVDIPSESRFIATNKDGKKKAGKTAGLA